MSPGDVANQVKSVPAGRRGRSFHLSMGVLFLVAALVGFGPTYFLKPIRSSPPLSPLLHLHGALFTVWLILMIVQSGLVRGRRLALHKFLGYASVSLAVLMVVVGYEVAIGAARRALSDPNRVPPEFLVFPLGALLLFAGFFAAGLWYRRAPEAHRRLMLLATVAIMPPAIARWPGVEFRPVLSLSLSVVFVLVAMAYDWLSRRVLHPVYLGGAAFILATGPARLVLGHSAAWLSFARVLIR